jgi:hypothetical protein
MNDAMGPMFPCTILPVATVIVPPASVAVLAPAVASSGVVVSIPLYTMERILRSPTEAEKFTVKVGVPAAEKTSKYTPRNGSKVSEVAGRSKDPTSVIELVATLEVTLLIVAVPWYDAPHTKATSPEATAVPYE